MSPSSSIIFFSFSTLSFGSLGIFKACFQGLRWAYLPSVFLGVSFCWYFSLNSHIHYMVAQMFMLEMTFESHLWILETAFYPRFCKRFCFVSNWSKLLLPSSSRSFPYFLRHAHLNSPQKCLGCSYATHSTSRCFRAAPQAEQWPMKSTSFNMGNTWGRGETSVLLGNRLQSMVPRPSWSEYPSQTPDREMLVWRLLHPPWCLQTESEGTLGPCCTEHCSIVAGLRLLSPDRYGACHLYFLIATLKVFEPPSFGSSTVKWTRSSEGWMRERNHIMV